MRGAFDLDSGNERKGFTLVILETLATVEELYPVVSFT